MNHPVLLSPAIFKAFNKTWQRTVAAGQLITFVLLFSSMPYVHAGPNGGTIVGGTGSISNMGNVTNINQLTHSLAIDWNSYNINTNEIVNYLQPNSSSIALNRILSNNASQIHGQINANGQVILVNPNGVFFSPTSSINVGGLIASGLAIDPQDFMNGHYIFNMVRGQSPLQANISRK